MEVVDIVDSTLDDVLELVTAHLDHIRLLALRPRDAHLPLERVPAVYRAFARAAPLLEVIDVQLFDYPFPEPGRGAMLEAHIARFPCQVPAELFSGQAPRLSQMSFRTMFHPPAAVAAFANLVRVELDAHFLASEHIIVIVSLPRLRCLHLEVAEYIVPQMPAPQGFRLDELWFFGRHTPPLFDPICPLLRYLGFPHIRHFTSKWDVMWLDTMTSSPRSLPHTLMIEEWRVGEDIVGTQAWRMLHDGGLVSEMLDVHTTDHFSWPDAQHVLANLRELIIPFRELRTAEYDLEFRELTRLCVRLNATHCSRDDWPDIRIPALKLRTIELWGGIDVSPIRIPSHDVVAFIGDFLTLDPAHRPDLVLRDVEIVQSRGGWEEVEELISSVHRPEEGSPESFVVELKSKWHASVQH
ncbi:hypothetical protein AURDEDRAFT_174500 [Auricularia subglabra TFB-10046 SS5]|uniref:F-box domain-containing protein n=1 Tax=Auricularia subglabra (strain TFB-10046 / SS5) TaxID=717982 RepID=J0WUK4_AURST|nr:hypothetical protein AURDEDRAFT_174500 [Auricularia subglabra TFB-10046 SS5]